MGNRESQPKLYLVLAAVAVYTVFFTVISFLRYNILDYSDFDFAIYVHECWKILHGSAQISIFNNTPIWGNSLELISFLTSPVFFLCHEDPRSLLFLQALSLGAAAIPLYLIARSKVGGSLAAALAMSYLFYPATWYANLYEYNPLVLATLTLLTAFYFFQEQRFGLFLLMIVLSLINRADVGIVTFMFGVYALLRRKSWRWVVVPSAVSVLWVIIGLLVIIPRFKGPLSYDSFYPQFGKGFAQIAANIILRPQTLWHSLVTAKNGEFLFQVLFPVGFIPFLALEELSICVLSLLQHLVSIRPQEHTIHFHYTLTITPFVYIAAAYGMAFLGRHRPRFFWPVLVVLFSVWANILYTPCEGF